MVFYNPHEIPFDSINNEVKISLMKYFIGFTILLIILIYGQIFEKEFPLAINILLISLILLVSFFQEYSVINKNFDADFKIRSQNKKVSSFQFSFSVFFTMLLFLNENYRHFIFIVLLIWIQPFVEIIMHFIYQSKKPYTLFINNNELTLNRGWTKKRNLNELTQIRFDRFSKILIFNFKSASKISIRTTEYNVEDIQKLLEISIEKSENDVFVPLNFESKL